MASINGGGIWQQLRDVFSSMSSSLSTITLFRHFPYANGEDRMAEAYQIEIPFTIGGGTTTGSYSIGVVPLDLGFWLSSFTLLCGQALINMAVAVFTYHFLLPASSSSSLGSSTHHDYLGEKNEPHQQHDRRLLLGYGLLLPTLLGAPIWLYSKWQSPNITLMLCLFGAVPNILTLRVVEAMHGMLPDFCKEQQTTTTTTTTTTNDGKAATTTTTTTTTISRRMLVLYYSSTLQLMFDKERGQPVPFTRSRFWKKLGHFLGAFLQTSLMFSLLLPVDYQLFPARPIASVGDLWYWGNLANTFCMASLTSLVLDGGCSGLGLLTSLCTGYTLEPFSDSPLTKSTSPSDFWGRRWDRPVESALRRGCYRPLRQAGGYSANVAAFGTFVVSGFIHEYVLWTMTFRSQHSYQPQYGNQFVFFLWNGMVLLMERFLRQQDKQFPLLVWMEKRLPRPVQTALVLLTVLPIGHLFTDEYIRSSFYDDTAWGFPILTCSISM